MVERNARLGIGRGGRPHEHRENNMEASSTAQLHSAAGPIPRPPSPASTGVALATLTVRVVDRAAAVAASAAHSAGALFGPGLAIT